MKLLLVCFFIIFSSLSQQASYSELIAAKAIQLSAAIYNISKEHQEANQCPDCYPQFKVVKQILGNQILSIIGVDKKLKYIIAVFRGSSNIQNFITDTQIFMAPYQSLKKCRGCMLHTGFYVSYQLLSNQGLQDIIKSLTKKYPTYGILFTGHSLGGAVATISAVKFLENNKVNDVQLYTVGQPRVGNQKYADYTNSLISNNFRIIHKRDIVPHKPAYLAFYRHSGYEVWYFNGMNKDFKGCKGDSNYCSNSLGNDNFDYSVNDHYNQNYIQLYYDKIPNKNIFQLFRSNNQGKDLKKKFINLQNMTIDWDQVIERVQNDLFDML